MVLSYFCGGSTPVKSDPEASDKEAVPTPDSAESDIEEVPQVQLLWTKNGLMDPKSGHMVTVPAPTKDADMMACYKMLETITSSDLGLDLMTSVMATKTKSPRTTPTKPSPVQDRARTVRTSPHERASSPPSPLQYPTRLYTRDYEWNQRDSEQVFEKFKTNFETLHAPIGDAALRHFKKAYGTWAQNCRERGRFEAFDYALRIAEHAYGDRLSYNDRRWILNQYHKINQQAHNQAVRATTGKHKSSSISRSRSP